MSEIFGLFGVTDGDVARRMTLREYRLRWRGYLLAFLDREYFAHLSAYASVQAQATDGKGKALYPTMADFYDKEARRQEVLGLKSIRKSNSYPKLMKIAQNLREYRKEMEV